MYLFLLKCRLIRLKKKHLKETNQRIFKHAHFSQCQKIVEKRLETWVDHISEILFGILKKLLLLSVKLRIRIFFISIYLSSVTNIRFRSV